MSSKFDESDFVDRDLEVAQESADISNEPVLPPASTQHPPSQEELTERVSETQQRLVELKQMQEDLERERTEIEESRRRRSELSTGREEMVQNLTRGVGILEEAELSSGRTAEQLSRTVADLRTALDKINLIDEEDWTEENWSVELTKALTTIENSRMEWNAARLKWPLLEGESDISNITAESQPVNKENRAGLDHLSFWQLSKLGLAFTWPLVFVGVAIIILLILSLN
jgi:septal ring factor EnvC (AmiA/AmiB activator)